MKIKSSIHTQNASLVLDKQQCSSVKLVRLVHGLSASIVWMPEEIGGRVRGLYMLYIRFMCVFPRVRKVFQAKPEHQEKKASLVGWGCQETKETSDLKDNQ